MMRRGDRNFMIFFAIIVVIAFAMMACVIFNVLDLVEDKPTVVEQEAQLSPDELAKREALTDGYAVKVLDMILEEGAAAPFLHEDARLTFLQECKSGAKFAFVQFEPPPQVDPIMKMRNDSAVLARSCLVRIYDFVTNGNKRTICCKANNCSKAENAYNSLMDAIRFADILTTFALYSRDRWEGYSFRANKHLKTLGKTMVELPKWYNPQTLALIGGGNLAN